MPTLLLTGVSGGAVLIGALAVAGPVRFGAADAEAGTRASAPLFAPLRETDRAGRPLLDSETPPPAGFARTQATSPPRPSEAARADQLPDATVQIPDEPLPSWRVVGGVPATPPATADPAQPGVDATPEDEGGLAAPDTGAVDDPTNNPDNGAADSGLAAAGDSPEPLDGSADGSADSGEQTESPQAQTPDGTQLADEGDSSGGDSLLGQGEEQGAGDATPQPQTTGEQTGQAGEQSGEQSGGQSGGQSGEQETEGADAAQTSQPTAQ